MKQVSGVILAAGKGIRMRSDLPAPRLPPSLTLRRTSRQAGLPKVLHKVGGKPLLHYVITTAQACDISPLYAVIGYQADKVKKAFQNAGVSWVNQKDQRGTAHALSLTASRLANSKGILLVLCGDTPLITLSVLQGLIQTHKNKNPACTVLTVLLNDPASYGRIVRTQHPSARIGAGQVTKIVEAGDATADERKINEINSGIYAFNPQKVYAALKGIKPNPKKGEYYLTDVVSLLVKKGEQVEAYVAPESKDCLGVNSPEELVAANRLMQERIQRHLINQGVTILDPTNTYIETDVEIGQDTIIYPFTVVRSGVRVGKHCELGPFSHLREGTVLADYAEIGNFTEAKKTRMGQHSKAKHLSYLGDGIIGDDVNIGAGTILANFDGKKKHQTIIEDGASTGSGTVLIAPVKMGKNSVTGAGAVVSKGQDVPKGETVIGVPAKPLRKKKSPGVIRKQIYRSASGRRKK